MMRFQIGASAADSCMFRTCHLADGLPTTLLLTVVNFLCRPLPAAHGLHRSRTGRQSSSISAHRNHSQGVSPCPLSVMINATPGSLQLPSVCTTGCL